ncbi:MAG: substrate-binding domain-containing protein [Actinomycetota bacterium]|jgi:ribose transport system substrate-binding protein|nr:substrate-binding domain-containing protein [Actinomycetota bacterium]
MKSRSWRVFQGAAVASVLAGSSLALAGGVAPVAGAAASHKYTVGFVVGAEADPFFQSMYVGAAAEAKKLGVNLVWQGDPVDYSPSTQIPVVEQVLGLKPNALVIAPTDTKALNPYIASAVKQGIKVLNVDSGSSYQKNITSWVTGNNSQGGKSAADALAQAMNYAKSCTAAKPCNVAIGVSSLTTSTDAARVAGFKAEIKAKFPHITMLNDVVSQSQPSVAQSAFAQDISAHKLAGIFAVDGTDAEGATAAVKASGSSGANIKIVGYDAYAANIQSMVAGGQGSLSAIISQQPTLEGQLIMEYAVKALQGKPVPHLQMLANITLTPKTAKSILAKYQYVAS